MEDRQVKRIESFIRRKVKEAGAKGVVIGLSGGVDSALVATLCTRALGKGKVKVLIMPESDTSSSDNINDAKKVAKLLGVECQVIDFSPVYGEFKKTIPIFKDGAFIPNGNLKARIRMSILYYFANRDNLLVAGTGNKSELMMGYFTRYGDGGVDFLPIGRLYKTEVKELAEKLGVPSGIIGKKPSPCLWVGQTAEGELGIGYDRLDIILKGVGRKSDARIAAGAGIGRRVVKRVRKRIKLMEFKRKMPEVA